MIEMATTADYLAAAKAVLAFALGISGVVLLWRDARDRYRRLNVKSLKPAAALAVVAAPAKPAVPPMALPATPRLATGSEFGRLTSVIDGAVQRLNMIETSQASASVQIDAAELALNRIVDEIADVMPDRGKRASVAVAS